MSNNPMPCFAEVFCLYVLPIYTKHPGVRNSIVIVFSLFLVYSFAHPLSQFSTWLSMQEKWKIGVLCRQMSQAQQCVM